MRKLTAIVLCMATAITFSACSSKDNSQDFQVKTGTRTESESTTASNKNDETGGDLFEIETVQKYPGTHEELLEFAYEELQDDARPELSTQIENLDDYDTIFLGYPNWNEDLPMPMYTFLEEYDLSGKTIIPFTTHGGSGFASTIQTIESLQPNATVNENGLSISRNSVADAKSDVVDWVNDLEL